MLPTPRFDRRPQATHRDLVPDDYRYGIDRQMTSPKRVANRRIAKPPALGTIYEERKLRTRRCELQDPNSGSTLRFSAAYCPRVYGNSYFEGLPFVAQEEHLENFCVLAKWHHFYINVTHTFPRERIEGVRQHALNLFRKAYGRGELR